jgi:hypothetical protein
VVRLKARKVAAGMLGQVEAVRENFAVVRFYAGSLAARSGGGVRRWYHNAGGPYGPKVESGSLSSRYRPRDDLFTEVQASVLEVSLEDVVELNDYLDEAATDTTAAPNRAGRKRGSE